MERIRAVRYKLRLPLFFKWTEASGNPIQEAAFTRDISPGGLFISCVECPPIRTSLSLEIMLPPNSEIRSHGVRLDATVQVVRIASATEEKGFAGAGDLAIQKGEYGRTLDSRPHSLSRETLRVNQDLANVFTDNNSPVRTTCLKGNYAGAVDLS